MLCLWAIASCVPSAGRQTIELATSWTFLLSLLIKASGHCQPAGTKVQWSGPSLSYQKNKVPIGMELLATRVILKCCLHVKTHWLVLMCNLWNEGRVRAMLIFRGSWTCSLHAGLAGCHSASYHAEFQYAAIQMPCSKSALAGSLLQILSNIAHPSREDHGGSLNSQASSAHTYLKHRISWLYQI